MSDTLTNQVSRVADGRQFELTLHLALVPGESILIRSAQTSEGALRVLPVNGDAAREDCRVLGYGDMQDLPPIYDRPHVLEIRVRADASGLVWVTARDVESGKTLELTADPSKVSQAA
jgi:molecular chaperone DnaK (HSP70)